MKRPAAILLIIYSVVMLSYGALEMSHDLLHYLARHHHTRVHHHAHGDHHHFNDHHHQTTVSHSHDTESSEVEFPSLISSYFFVQNNSTFSFYTSFTGKVFNPPSPHCQHIDHHPLTPPPQG